MSRLLFFARVALAPLAVAASGLRRAAAWSFALTLAATLAAAPLKFDLPAQPLPTSLMAVARQAGVKVLFSHSELKELKAPALAGECEPAEALARLVAGTGYVVVPQGAKQFLVRKATAGSVRGALLWPEDGAAAGVHVALRGTGLAATTDAEGQYFFPEVPAGTYLLIAQADGYQPLHVTNVTVRAGQELVLAHQTMRKSTELTKLEPFVVTAEAVTRLDEFEVSDRKTKPFSDGNVDIPRTIDDVQPYAIFDVRTIEQSGATNIEDFLKERLTMNATALTNGQDYNQQLGNTSAINLRALGIDKTLVLVNGRRLPTVSLGTNYYQPDINGIPVSSIERIEVLPSSASGIYGGGAIGGVVNIILKKDYSGGELRMSYDNTFDTDSARRSASLSYGFALEGGRTHVMLSVTRSDANTYLLQDRLGEYRRGFDTILANSPSYFYTATQPFMGATPNIAPTSTTLTTLTLKNGTALGSRNTHISPGTAPGASTSALYASLLANAGSWNFNLSEGNQTETSLRRAFGMMPKVSTFRAGVRRQMLPALEAFADFSYNENRAVSRASPFTAPLVVRSTWAISPFTTDVNVRFPYAGDLPYTTSSTNRSATVGIFARLPRDWTGQLDYTWSDNRVAYGYAVADSAALTTAMQNGTLNPFVDTLLYPLDLDPYLGRVSYRGTTLLSDLALRGSGPLPALPWGEPTLTVGLEHRVSKGKDKVFRWYYPVTVSLNYIDNHYPLAAQTDSAYAELNVPLVKKDRFPLLHALELQLSGRNERFVVDAGTPYVTTYYDRTPVAVVYAAPTRNGAPYFERDRYGSNNFTIGFKYEPVRDLTLRASRATAFLPPTPDQLAPQNEPSSTTTTITDPQSGARVAVRVVTGGNPSLVPQNSRSTNLGAIWTPSWKPLQGLRLNLEYYQIEQFDYIGALSAQQIVNAESTFPDRVTRDSTGTITTVNTTRLNLYHRLTAGWDASLSYTRMTPVGAFSLTAAASRISHLKNQYLATEPEYDAAGYAPVEGGGPKNKGNATFAWDWRSWSAGWTVRYTDGYKQYGADGSPIIQTTTNALLRTIARSVVVAQGSESVASQTYHDWFAGYAFGKQRAESAGRVRALASHMLSGLTVQVGVRNVFGTLPPFDAYYSSYYYFSAFGDARLRSYWVSLKKTF